MIITIRNNADLPGKYERRVKWLIYNLTEKFNDLIYANVYFNKEGFGNPTYAINLVIGLPGQELVFKNTGEEMAKLIMQIYHSAKRNIAKKLRTKRR